MNIKLRHVFWCFVTCWQVVLITYDINTSGWRRICSTLSKSLSSPCCYLSCQCFGIGAITLEELQAFIVILYSVKTLLFESDSLPRLHEDKDSHSEGKVTVPEPGRAIPCVSGGVPWTAAATSHPWPWPINSNLGTEESSFGVFWTGFCPINSREIEEDKKACFRKVLSKKKR